MTNSQIKHSANQPWHGLSHDSIIGYPGETESDHDALLRFVEENRNTRGFWVLREGTCRFARGSG